MRRLGILCALLAGGCFDFGVLSEHYDQGEVDHGVIDLGVTDLGEIDLGSSDQRTLDQGGSAPDGASPPPMCRTMATVTVALSDAASADEPIQVRGTGNLSFLAVGAYNEEAQNGVLNGATYVSNGTESPVVKALLKPPGSIGGCAPNPCQLVRVSQPRNGSVYVGYTDGADLKVGTLSPAGKALVDVAHADIFGVCGTVTPTDEDVVQQGTSWAIAGSCSGPDRTTIEPNADTAFATLGRESRLLSNGDTTSTNVLNIFSQSDGTYAVTVTLSSNTISTQTMLASDDLVALGGDEVPGSTDHAALAAGVNPQGIVMGVTWSDQRQPVRTPLTSEVFGSTLPDAHTAVGVAASQTGFLVVYGIGSEVNAVYVTRDGSYASPPFKVNDPTNAPATLPAVGFSADASGKSGVFLVSMVPANTTQVSFVEVSCE